MKIKNVPNRVHEILLLLDRGDLGEGKGGEGSQFLNFSPWEVVKQ